MVAFSAVSYRDKAGTKPALGTIKLEADTSVALAERLVSFKNLRTVEANFQTLPKEQMREVVATIEKTMSGRRSRHRARSRARQHRQEPIVPKNVEGIKADPPTIFFSTTPAVMVNIDGDPIWSPIKENDLKFAVNTNWDLFQHVPTNTLLPAAQHQLAEGGRRQRPVDGRRHAARQLQEAAAGRQLEGRQGQSARASRSRRLRCRRCSSASRPRN